MDPKLWELLRKSDENDDEEVEAIIRLDQPQKGVSGLRIISRFGPIATCRLKKKEIISTREAENVLSLKAAVRIAPEKEPDESYGQFDFPRNTSQNRLRRPKGLSQKGAGVIIGIVDFGCDFNHTDLKNEDGSTRLLALWHQGGNGSTGIENKFGYGTIFTRQHIDWALRQPDPYRALGYQPGIASHGTHVTGIAAGNGLGGGPEGVAPEADIIFVHMASKGTGGLSNLGNSVRLLEAIDFVTEIAQNRPWVINLSVGLQGGPHDFSTPVDKAFEHLLLEGPNRFIVQSTGNYFNKNIHASGRLREGEVKALRIIIDETDQTPNELEIWYTAGDVFMVKTESPNGTKSKWVRLGKSSEVLENGIIVGMLYNRKNDPNNSDHLINLFLDPIASFGEWIIHIKALVVSNGVYHAWLERDDCPGCQPRFPGNQSNKFYTTGTLANGRIPLVVGAYNAYSPNREVSPFSSVGPTRDNRPKPDLVAPGESELSARSDTNPDKWNSELYIRKSGTSMAAPHVTGAVALCLQASSRPLNCYEIRELILSNTEKISNNVQFPIRYGHGYLDITKAIKSTLALSTPSNVQKEFPTISLKEEVYPEKTNIMKEKINEAIAEIDNLLVLSTLEDSKINLLTEIMQPLQSSKNVISLSADELYENIVYKRNGQISETIAENFDVLAQPGELLDEPPLKGDLLLRVALGEPGLGHVAMISESTLISDDELSEFALASESQQPGFYSTIIEGGSFPHMLRDSFARRILESNGEMPPGQVLIRPRQYEIEERHIGSLDNIFDEQVAGGRANQIPTTLKVLIDNLTNLIFWERNPKLTDMTLTDDQRTLRREWRTIRTNEVVPALRHSSTSFRISQLLFFHRHPSVKGRFKALSRSEQDRFQKIFNNIRRNEVRTLLGSRLARGSLRSRTIFVIDDQVYKALPVAVRTSCGNELADVFDFIGKSQSSLPMKVVFVTPDRLPEGFNFSDAVVRVVTMNPDIELKQALRAQMKNIILVIKDTISNRVQSSQMRRSTLVHDRIGVASHNKHTILVGTRSLALPIMASVVDLNEVIKVVLDDFSDRASRLKKHLRTLSGEKLLGAKNQLMDLQRAINHPDKPKQWRKTQQIFLGEVLGRVMAHEVRHLYVVPADEHADDGLGADRPQLTRNPKHERFTTVDQLHLRNNISRLELNQGNADVMNTFALGRRGFDFPF